jgi:hypothetical protein
MRVSEVRELITTTLHDLGLGDAKPAGEHLLIKDQFYLGCRFDFEGASAIWLENSAQVRFFSDTGKLLKVIRVSQTDEVAKQVA